MKLIAIAAVALIVVSVAGGFGPKIVLRVDENALADAVCAAPSSVGSGIVIISYAL